MKLNADSFNLDVTLCCGQVFRWDKKGDWWYGIVGNTAFKVRQKNAELESVNVDETTLEHYFRLDEDYAKIVSSINKDAHINKAIEAFRGLRLVRQDPWECLISYICATYKGIAAINQMLLRLSKKFGERVTFEDHDFYTFPAPEKLARTTEDSLATCGLGYRAKYVLETSRKICEGSFELESLKQTPYQQAKKTLFTLPGVGLKVADCVLLFSLEKPEAFPVDIWILRTLLRHYSEHFPKAFIEKLSSQESLSNSAYEKLNAFGRNHFGEYAGYAQEYLYHYERMQH